MRRILKSVLPFVFLALGILAFVALKSMTATAERAETPTPHLTVEVLTVTPTTHTASVRATGTVQAATRIDLVAQVPGKVVSIADGLTPGAHFRQGDVIARIDSRDYQANVTQAEANVMGAELEVSLEEGRVRQASREWELLGSEAGSALATREPQLAASRARLASARAALDTAKLGLERTRLVAPFNSIVTAEALDVGQYVAPGAPVASLIGTDRFRVRVSVPVRDLAWLELPEAGTTGSRALVTQDLGNGHSVSTEGFVLRMLGELDAETRTAGVLIAIDNPLEVPDGTLPILPGAYVTVQIEGRSVNDVAEVPRVAVVEGTYVWVADAEDRLLRKPIEIAWGTADHVYATSGLTAGDRVVLTPIALPVEGMPLDVQHVVAEAR